MHLMEDVLGRLWVDYIFWESLLAPVREVPLLLQPTFHTFAVRNFRLPVGCFFLGLATIVNPLDGPFFFERGHELLGAGFSPIEAVDYVRENQHLLSISMYDRGTGTIVTLYGDFDYGLCWVPHTGDGTGEPHWLPYTGLVPSSDTSSGSSLPGSEAFWHSDSSDSGFSYPSIFGGSEQLTIFPAAPTALKDCCLAVSPRPRGLSSMPMTVICRLRRDPHGLSVTTSLPVCPDVRLLLLPLTLCGEFLSMWIASGQSLHLLMQHLR
jgi:hypothetical protein